MRRILVALALVASFWDLHVAFAEPQYAIRYARYSQGPLRCSNCHVNPTGAGLRNATGREVFAESLMAMDTPLLGGPSQFQPVLGEDDWFRYGGDLRILYLRRNSKGVDDLEHSFPQPGDPSVDGAVVQTPQGFFFPMEIELEGAMELLDGDLTIMFPVGLFNLEVTGIYSGVPWDGWIKAGRFYPTYGIRTANHTMYHRTPLGYDAVGHDVGVEIGAYPTDNTRIIGNVLMGKQPCQVQWQEARAQEIALRGTDVVCDTGTPRHWKQDEAGMWYARLEEPYAFYGQDFDRPVQAATVVADWTTRPGEDLVLTLGASGYAGLFDKARVGKVGPYLMLNWGNGVDNWNLTYLAEVDYLHMSPLEPQTVNVAVSMQELTLTPLRGLDLIASVESYDPDLERSGDAIQRYAVGTQVFPTRWADLRVHYRFTTGDLSLNHRARERDLLAVMHFFF